MRYWKFAKWETRGKFWPVSDDTSLGKWHSFNLPLVFAGFFEVDSRTDRNLYIRFDCLRRSLFIAHVLAHILHFTVCLIPTRVFRAI